jgi:DNA-binding GntR family transcriptional regulator
MAANSQRRKPPRPRLRGSDVRERIRDQLQRLILGGTLRPGTRLVQQRLAGQLGVCQSVIREALLELQVCGLVETDYNRGMFVGQLDAERLLESFDVREAHECLAVRLCCDRVARVELRELTQLADQVFELGRAGKHARMAALDREFHQRLIELSGNGMLARLSHNFWVLGKTIRAGRAPRTVRDEHLAILKAIDANQPEKAERLMRKHIQAGRQLVEKQVRHHRFAPAWVT